ncbi:MAG: SpoIIE family protein phosphatase [Planctomycetes bacterium]|nr:SpoIIE family protein phosphatase [Planctomycetota bacterium]
MADYTTMIQGPLPGGEDDALEHSLVFTEGASRGRRVVIEDGESLEIGRKGPGLVLDDPSVSGRHCRIRRDGPALTVADLGSTNGTFIGGTRVEGTATLPVGMLLRVGGTALRHECRAPDQVEAQGQQRSEFERAARYVQALLPEPISHPEIAFHWCFVPSEQLGGDGLGYQRTDDRWSFYVLDVSGHGLGSALHAVSILNVLQKRSLPDVDFGSPAEVLSALNARFGMRDHGGLFFTLWYGVWDPATRRLEYASAGHPPGLLVDASGEGEVVRLQTPSLALGILPQGKYPTESVVVAACSRLYLFTDGVYDIETPSGQRWTVDDLEQLILEGDGPTGPNASEPERIRQGVERASGATVVDDFTLVAIAFESVAQAP